jgi:hypothetical protein
MLLHALLRAQQYALALCRHCSARLGGELGVPVRETVVCKTHELEKLDALAFRVSLERLGESGLKLFCGLAVSRRDGLAGGCHGITTATGPNGSPPDFMPSRQILR